LLLWLCPKSTFVAGEQEANLTPSPGGMSFWRKLLKLLWLRQELCALRTTYAYFWCEIATDSLLIDSKKSKSNVEHCPS
jgi:hypothetical protein